MALGRFKIFIALRSRLLLFDWGRNGSGNARHGK
jgi:hypothetical protein